MKKIFVLAVLCLSFFAQAVELPVHHQYITYQGDVNGDVRNHDIHVKWNADPDVSQMGYYAMYAFYFQNGVGGYMGLQKDHTDGKKAIFSIWDYQNTQSAFPVTPHCKRFGHEGAGAQCIISFDWKPNREYKIRIWRINEELAHAQRWGAWVIDYETGEETPIGIIETRNSGGHHGYGGLKTYSLGVIENYQTTAVKHVGCEAIKDFSVTWNGPFYNNGQASAVHASFDYNTGMGNPCQELNNASSNAPHTVKTEAGTGVVNERLNHNDLWSKHNPYFLAQVDCVFNWAENAAPHTYNQSVHRHRRLSKSFFNYYMRDYRKAGTGHALIVDTINKTTLLGKPDGTMEGIGDFNHWLVHSGCKR